MALESSCSTLHVEQDKDWTKGKQGRVEQHRVEWETGEMGFKYWAFITRYSEMLYAISFLFSLSLFESYKLLDVKRRKIFAPSGHLPRFSMQYRAIMHFTTFTFFTDLVSLSSVICQPPTNELLTRVNFYYFSTLSLR